MRLQARFWTQLSKKLALSSAVFLVGLCLSEVAFRGWLWLRGTPYDAEATHARLKDSANPIAAFLPRVGRLKLEDEKGKPIGILHPFTGSESEHDTGGVLAHFLNGPPKDEYSVLIVGGSVASLFAVTGGPELEQALKNDPRFVGRKVHVLNYAHPSFKEPQQLMRVAYLLSLGYTPDAVINIDGFNEVALAFENSTLGTHPLYPSFPTWGIFVQDFGPLDPRGLDLTLELWQLRNQAHGLVDAALRWNLCNSSLAGRFIEARVSSLMDRRFAVQMQLNEHTAEVAGGKGLNRQLRGPDFAPGRDKVFELCVRNWYESSISIQSMCNARDILYLHVLQPTLHDPGSKALSPQEEKIPPGPPAWQPAVVRGYPLLRARSKDLEQHGVHFLDASQAFADVKTPLYFDACHFNPIGNKILARFIAPYFLEHVLDRNAAAGAHSVDAQGVGEPR